MEQNQKGAGLVDLLEIYHARQLRDHIIAQLRRLHTDRQQLPIQNIARHKESVRYYEAPLLTVAEMLQAMGDTEAFV